MTDRGQWLIDLKKDPIGILPDGLVAVAGYNRSGRPPEEVAVMEKAQSYDAEFVFFEAGQNGRPPTAQAFVFISDGPEDDQHFANLHKRLWSWGGVPHDQAFSSLPSRHQDGSNRADNRSYPRR
jgi:hypothetical protein